jgi:hypothetical protein
MISDGKSLYALCHYPKSSKRISFFNPRQPWGMMSFARRGDRVIFCSEDMDTGHWQHLSNPEIISATISGSSVSVKRGPLRARTLSNQLSRVS